jgi:iron-sulfur cluster assembly protein
MTESITITDRAVAAVKDALSAEKLPEADTYLRVGVRAGGCSGYSYDLQFVQEKDQEDQLIERDGIRLVVDPRSGVLLRGTELDYTSGLNGRGFVFRNPNASGTCGCGESFSV